ncbi:hypothetical protein [Streptomyces sp. NPDC101181]|uniref:hypothetical protein n=1 Tax=Streptomyces sp. NPDC101181 TaxID=3366125 RepID=UPI0038192A42
MGRDDLPVRLVLGRPQAPTSHPLKPFRAAGAAAAVTRHPDTPPRKPVVLLPRTLALTQGQAVVRQPNVKMHWSSSRFMKEVVDEAGTPLFSLTIPPPGWSRHHGEPTAVGGRMPQVLVGRRGMTILLDDDDGALVFDLKDHFESKSN